MVATSAAGHGSQWCMTTVTPGFAQPLRVSRVLPSQKGLFSGVCVLKQNTYQASDLRRLKPKIIAASQLDKVDAEKTTPQLPSKSVSIKIERFITGAAYAGFVLFALFLAPGSLSNTGEIGRIVGGKLDDVNELFFALFCLMGTLSINMAVLLNPGAGAQKRLSTGWFSFAGVFLGFGALGPYLIGREYAPSVYSQDISKRGLFGRLVESKGFSVGTLLFTLWTYAFALGAFTPGTTEIHDAVLYASFKSLGRLLLTDRFVCVTTLDGLLLSVLTWGPLTEDMRRRGWFVSGKKLESILTALSILSTPGVGVALYLILRPRLPRKK